jgi:hypothetical protein
VLQLLKHYSSFLPNARRDERVFETAMVSLNELWVCMYQLI